MVVQKVALTMSNGECRVMLFLVVGRGNVLPTGATWFNDKPESGKWLRPANDQNILAEIAKTFTGVGGDPTVVSYRPMAEGEDQLATEGYRGARVDRAGRLQYDVDKLRECHREVLRRQRIGAFQQLDAEWMRALGQGKTDEAAVIEWQRQALRDAPSDPRIDAASTIEELSAITLVVEKVVP